MHCVTLVVLTILLLVPKPTLEAVIPVVTTTTEKNIEDVTTIAPSNIEKSTVMPDITDVPTTNQHSKNSSMAVYPAVPSIDSGSPDSDCVGRDCQTTTPLPVEDITKSRRKDLIDIDPPVLVNGVDSADMIANIPGKHDGTPTVPKKGVALDATDDQHISGRKGVDDEPTVEGRKGVAVDDNTPIIGRKGVDLDDGLSKISGRKGVVDEMPTSTTNATVAAEPDITSSTKLVVEEPSHVTTKPVGLSADDEPNHRGDPTPATSVIVGGVFGAILIAVLLFVGVKRLDAVRRRRNYRRMNDFLIDGMYNDM